MTAADLLLLALLVVVLVALGVLGLVIWRLSAQVGATQAALASAQVTTHALASTPAAEPMVPAAVVSALVAQIGATAEVVARSMGEALAPPPLQPLEERLVPVGDPVPRTFDGEDPTDALLSAGLQWRTFEPGGAGDDFGLGAPIATPPVGL